MITLSVFFIYSFYQSLSCRGSIVCRCRLSRNRRNSMPCHGASQSNTSRAMPLELFRVPLSASGQDSQHACARIPWTGMGLYRRVCALYTYLLNFSIWKIDKAHTWKPTTYAYSAWLFLESIKPSFLLVNRNFSCFIVSESIYMPLTTATYQC